jgi:hydrogenase maturation protease
MSDDAVGLHVARELRRRIEAHEADVDEASAGGLRLLDVIQGYHKLIVIDAIQTGEAPPGTLHRVPLEMKAGTHRLAWQHGMDFHTALRFGQRVGMNVPSVVAIYGVEVHDPYCFGEHLSPEIEEAVPGIATTIVREAFPHLTGGGQGRGERGHAV